MKARRRFPARAFAIVAALAASANAPGCGLEDPNSLGMRRGFLNIAFPDSLHVGTAVWQAQVTGELPREAVASDPALTDQARAMLASVQANWLARRFAARLATGPEVTERPRIALVMLGPVLWTRFAWQENSVSIDFHADGPAHGDVVLVTDIPVIDAIVNGRLTMSRAFELRLARLYGEPERQRTVLDWLVAAGQG